MGGRHNLVFIRCRTEHFLRSLRRPFSAPPQRSCCYLCCIDIVYLCCDVRLYPGQSSSSPAESIWRTAEDRKFWPFTLEFVILCTAKVQGCIPLAAERPPSQKVGSGTGGHHERCSEFRERQSDRARSPAVENPSCRFPSPNRKNHLPDGIRLSDRASAG